MVSPPQLRDDASVFVSEEQFLRDPVTVARLADNVKRVVVLASDNSVSLVLLQQRERLDL